MAGKSAMLPTLFIASSFACLMFASGLGAITYEEGTHGVLDPEDVQEILDTFARLITGILQGSQEYAYGSMFVANLVTPTLGDRVTIRCFMYGYGRPPAQCRAGPGGPGRIVNAPAYVVGAALSEVVRVTAGEMVGYGATYFIAVAEHFGIQYFMNDYEPRRQSSFTSTLKNSTLRFGNGSFKTVPQDDAHDCWVFGSTLISGYKDMHHQSLYAGGSLFSPNGRYRLTMQFDCNLVQYLGSQPVWATDTARHDSNCKLRMQIDGNLVLYSGSEEPIWATGRHCEPQPHCQDATIFTVQDDCDMVIYETGSPMKPLWASMPMGNYKN